jgi:hypothetical protein
MFRDIRPGPVGSSPIGLVASASVIVFAADDGVRGREPWILSRRLARLVSDVCWIEVGGYSRSQPIKPSG